MTFLENLLQDSTYTSMSRRVCFCYGPQGVDANIRALTSIKSNRPQKINYFIGKFRNVAKNMLAILIRSPAR